MYSLYVKQQDQKTVTVGLTMRDARRLLEALKDNEATLGSAEDLIEALEEAGITVPDPQDHVRYEYVPPRDLDPASDHAESIED
ncbi:MAG: hypothetical protein GWO02_22975 [Gammaproteobacteria bacterium]|nr:hypothetical protein [Gammaproteobacteria bacterium]